MREVVLSQPDYAHADLLLEKLLLVASFDTHADSQAQQGIEEVIRLLEDVLAGRRSAHCEFHHHKLEVKHVQILYGEWDCSKSPKFSREYKTALANNFPFNDDVPLGGCIGAKKTTRKLICEGCISARNEWLREHYAAWAETRELARI